MNPTGQAVIAIRRPDDWVGRSWRSFVVRIDGRRAGKVKPGPTGRGPTEFAVEPGTHTVAVSMDWVRSQSLPVVVEPGSRTELVIRGRPDKLAWWKNILPIVIAVLIGQGITDVLLDVTGLAGANWWARTGTFLAVYLVLYAGFILLASRFWQDYRALWTLEPAGAGSPQGKVGG